MELLKSVDPVHGALAAGIAIVIIVLFRQLRQRWHTDTQKQKERENAIRAAREAERSSLMQSGVQRSKVIQPKNRMPLGDPLGTPFTGNIQGIAAKWEVEIHKLGRQIIGQIDSKMSALQTITLDANRTANRLEILVEHLEQIARQQMEWQQNQREQSAETEKSPAEGTQTVIPATVSFPEKADPLGNVLKELADDLDDIHQTIKRSTVLREQPEPATILRMASETAYSNLRSEVEMLANYGLEPQDIAQRLNISLGEVDLMLQVQQNRLDRTM